LFLALEEERRGRGGGGEGGRGIKWNGRKMIS
jgi:hypothetical protein